MRKTYIVFSSVVILAWLITIVFDLKRNVIVYSDIIFHIAIIIVMSFNVIITAKRLSEDKTTEKKRQPKSQSNQSDQSGDGSVIDS